MARSFYGRAENQVSGFSRQLSIVLWKDFLLFKRNKVSALFEASFAVLLVCLLLIFRLIVERFYHQNQYSSPANVFDLYGFGFSSQNLIVYYPDNQLIENVVSQAVNILGSNSFLPNMTSKYRWIGYKVKGKSFCFKLLFLSIKYELQTTLGLTI